MINYGVTFEKGPYGGFILKILTLF